MRTIYNEGRVVGLSSYELYVRQTLANDPTAQILSESQWLATGVVGKNSMILKVPSGTSAGYADFYLPQDSDLCGCTLLHATIFEGAVELDSSGHWATKVTDYGRLIRNDSSASPVTPGDSLDVPTKPEPGVIRRDFEAQCYNYLRINSALMIQPGTWEGSGPKTFTPDLDKVGFVRLALSEALDTDVYIYIFGFTSRSVLKQTGAFSAAETDSDPSNGGFLGPQTFPWSCKIALESTSEVFSAVIQNTVDAIYPPGAIYLSYTNTNPSAMFPWMQWELLPDGYLRNNAPNATGGSLNSGTYKLTDADLPAHTHTFTTGSAGNHTHTLTTSNNGSHTHTTDSKGAHTHTTVQVGITTEDGVHSHTVSGTVDLMHDHPVDMSHTHSIAANKLSHGHNIPGFINKVGGSSPKSPMYLHIQSDGNLVLTSNYLWNDSTVGSHADQTIWNTQTDNVFEEWAQTGGAPIDPTRNNGREVIIGGYPGYSGYPVSAVNDSMERGETTYSSTGGTAWGSTVTTGDCIPTNPAGSGYPATAVISGKGLLTPQTVTSTTPAQDHYPKACGAHSHVTNSQGGHTHVTDSQGGHTHTATTQNTGGHTHTGTTSSSGGATNSHRHSIEPTYARIYAFRRVS